MTDARDDMRLPGPSPHVTDDEIARLARGALTASELIACSDHLAACGACRSRAASPARIAAARADFETAIGLADSHVPEDEVHAYVGGTLEAARRVEIDAHLEDCAACAAEILDLQQFARHTPDTRGGRRSWWYAGLAAAAVLLLGILALQRTPSSPAMLMVLNDGNAHIGIDVLGNIEGVSGLQDADRSRLARAVSSGRLTLPAAALSLSGSGGPLRGPAVDAAFRIVAPAGTAVLSDQPPLRWTPVSDGATYIVRLRDEVTGSTVVSPALRATEWRPEAPLTRGDTYVWQVEASAGGREITAPLPPSPAARFIVLSADEATRVTQAPASHFVRGVLDADAGLLDDAERELAELKAQNPGSAIVQGFVEQLRRARRSPSDGAQQ